jgi:hypothetical protein
VGGARKPTHPAAHGGNDEQIETTAGRLGLEPNVTAVRWQAIERNGQRRTGDPPEER